MASASSSCSGSCLTMLTAGCETRAWAISVGVVDIAAVLPVTCIAMVLGLMNHQQGRDVDDSIIINNSNNNNNDELHHHQQHLAFAAAAAAGGEANDSYSIDNNYNGKYEDDLKNHHQHQVMAPSSTSSAWRRARLVSFMSTQVDTSVGYWSILRFLTVSLCAYLVVQGTRRSQAWMLNVWMVNAGLNFLVTLFAVTAYAILEGSIMDNQLESLSSVNNNNNNNTACVLALLVIAAIGCAQFPIVYTAYKRAKRLAKTATQLTPHHQATIAYDRLA
ncbi:unnamed protein product [Notodromas monacha]|uniref:Uncharacterized protein n=1 Tax=Notodromas monacha TaxID=399045 RepID=A0A7R9BIM2_9CRUS|nr:unnamed protein product [Notodromas monacha]CAG0914622.1 unnamed protein product [Notodromas monacha]